MLKLMPFVNISLMNLKLLQVLLLLLILMMIRILELRCLRMIYPVFRYELISYRFYLFNNVRVLVTYKQALKYLSFLKSNLEDSIHYVKNKTIVIFDIGYNHTVGSGILTQFKEYFSRVDTEYIFEASAKKSPYFGFFNPEWYAEQYMSELKKSHILPEDHYLLTGWKRRCKPFENFDIVRFYIENPLCDIEPLQYWYEQQPTKMYFLDKILPELIYDNQHQFTAIQKLYMIQQNIYINDILPLDTACQSITLIFAPSIYDNDIESMVFRSIYQYEVNHRVNNIVVAVLKPTDINHSGLTFFSEEILCLRYNQISYRVSHFNEIHIMLPLIHAISFLEYLRTNHDDPLLSVSQRRITIINEVRFQNIPDTLLEQYHVYFDEVALKGIYSNSTIDSPYFGFFDSHWYRKTYMTEKSLDSFNPIAHYLTAGWKRKYKPFLYFDIDHFYEDNPDCDIEPLLYWYEKKIPKFYFTTPSVPQTKISGSEEHLLQLYRIIQDKTIDTVLPYNNECHKILILFVSPLDVITGGIMSFYGIYRLSRELQHIHNRLVIAVTFPYPYTHSGFTMFDNDMPVFRYEQIALRMHHVQDVLIMLPELYTQQYFDFLIENPDDPVLRACKRHLNIMNQNIDVMAEPQILHRISKLFPLITQTTAHYKYCTLKDREYYGIPTHLLIPPIFKHFRPRPYEEKEDLFVYSYDEKPWKKAVLKTVARDFPELEQIEIKDISFREYMDLIGRAKWCMTFGEGLDGYFTEPYQSNGISFAVWNDSYFTDNYIGLPTIFNNSKDAINRITAVMRALDNKVEYEKANLAVRKAHDIEYATKRTPKDQLADFFMGKYDYP